MTEPEKISIEEIYKQNCEDHRFFGDMRFKQLTLWSVGMGYVLNVLYGKESKSLTVHQIGIWYVAAFFWTSVIWVMEVRSSKHGVRRMELKRKLEWKKDVGLSNKWTLLNSTNAVAFLYAISCLILVVQLAYIWGPHVITVWAVALTFILLIAFTCREYLEMWQHAIKHWQN